jgi:4-amino-4-deoxychorismate lyase
MSSKIPFITANDAIAKIRQLNPERQYWLMYSSLYEGFVRDPEAMVIPIDDHIVHRGDGIFEAMRFHGRKIFELKAHLDRLFKSADIISMKMPKTRSEIEALCQQIVEASPDHGILRLFVSRGHGDFAANPYSTTGAQLMLLTMPFKKMPSAKYEKGASLIFSAIPVKQGFFSQVKSCNYLANVLTKKESIDRGADFAINITEKGYVAEGPTENVMILTTQNELIAPEFDYTLRGTTLVRVQEIARQHAAQLGLRAVRTANLNTSAFIEAREVMMVGTTLGVLPITQIENRSVADGLVGPVARALNAYLENEMGANS